MLSDEQIDKIMEKSPPLLSFRSFARAIEAECAKENPLWQKTAEALGAELDALKRQQPVAWCFAYDDPRMGRIHSTPSMCEAEVDAHVAKCEGRIVKAPLYAAPQPALKAEDIPFKATIVFDHETRVITGTMKDLPKAEQQEPVATVLRNTHGSISANFLNKDLAHGAKLYLAPPDLVAENALLRSRLRTEKSATEIMYEQQQRIAELEAALAKVRNWCESERKSISKGSGSAWCMHQMDEQIAAIDEVDR